MAGSELDIPVQSVAFLGAFLPRTTRYSAWNTAVCQAFSGEFCDCECVWIAVSDAPDRYTYPARVRFEILQSKPESYRAAFDFLSLKDVQAIYLGYDPILFDRDFVSLINLLQSLAVPIITWPGEVLPEQSGKVQEDYNRLLQVSSRLIVFSQEDLDRLVKGYGMPVEKVDLIHLNPDDPADSDKDPKTAARALMEDFQTVLNAAAQESLNHRTSVSIPVTGRETSGPHSHELPDLKLDHFLRMTDETGIFRASVYSLPDYQQGYTTSDNALALMFSIMLQQVAEGPFIPVEMQSARHLAFLYSAFTPSQGRFREMLSFTRVWQDEEGSEECHGLAVWALGMVLGRSQNVGIKRVARQLFEAALPAVNQFSSPRAWAFILLGIQEYLRRFSGDRLVQRTGKILLDRLMRMYRETASQDWPWFEESLGAGSICLSQALIGSAQWSGGPEVVQTGLKTLGWLSEIQLSQGRFSPVGDAGYYRRGGQRARFAQRPLEARGMVSACLEAYRMTSDARWLDYARGAFQWFLGQNDLGQPLYDPEMGGCCDALLPGKTSSNYSAKALLSFLLAQLEMRLLDQLYHQRMASSAVLPILQIALPASTMHSAD